jgi:hypothetical protein
MNIQQSSVDPSHPGTRTYLHIFKNCESTLIKYIVQNNSVAEQEPQGAANQIHVAYAKTRAIS